MLYGISKRNWFSEKLKEMKTVWIPYLNEVQIGWIFESMKDFWKTEMERV